jgi:hypothetical protein
MTSKRLLLFAVFFSASLIGANVRAGDGSTVFTGEAGNFSIKTPAGWSISIDWKKEGMEFVQMTNYEVSKGEHAGPKDKIKFEILVFDDISQPNESWTAQLDEFKKPTNAAITNRESIKLAGTTCQKNWLDIDEGSDPSYTILCQNRKRGVVFNCFFDEETREMKNILESFRFK